MVKKIPLRKCCATGEQHPKQEMIRVVKDNENKVFIDLSGRKNGRGAYLSCSLEALDVCKKKNSLGRSLEVQIPETIYQELEKIISVRVK